MQYYGPRELEASFRTVRANTITVAEDIPAENYSFRAAPEVRSVGEMLAHIAVSPMWHIDIHNERATLIDFERFSRRVQEATAATSALQTKDDILSALHDNGERFASFLASLDEDTLAERINFPAPLTPSSRTRFDMLQGAKEHEMHHRAQLMLCERMLGIVPHLTRRQQAARAQMQAQPQTDVVR